MMYYGLLLSRITFSLTLQAMATYYGGSEPCNGFSNMVDAVAQHAASTTQALGCAKVDRNVTLPSYLRPAVALAAAADKVVMTIGQDGTIEHEGHDRISISLSGCQRGLVAAIAAVAKAPITVVILTGGAVDTAEMLANPKIGAIIHAGQPSVTVLGVGDLIFGDAVPAGRMVQTVYPADYIDQVSIFDMNMRPGPSVWPIPNHSPKTMGTNPGRTHRFYTGKATHVFGFGLSYTTFKYTLLNAPTVVDIAPLSTLLASDTSRTFFKKDPTNPLVSYSVNVTNTGAIDADDVVLGFLTPPGAGTDGVELQTLFGFQRVHVKAGKTVTVWLAAEAQAFSTVNAAGTRVALPGKWGVHFGVESTAQHGMGFVPHQTMLV